MSGQTTAELRRQFYEQHQSGATYGEIAERYHVSSACVRYWCRRQRKGGHSVKPRGRAVKGWLSRFAAEVRYVVLRLRLEHPHWGPGRIRHHLGQRPSLAGRALPSQSSIGRYLHQWRRFRRRPRKKPTRPQVEPSTLVHQRWQVDFKVAIHLQCGLYVNLHTVRDPVGAACIGAFVFATGPHPGRVTQAQVQAMLRQCFERWHTLPDEIQTDAEPVLVGPHKNAFPSAFTLWLAGLGIRHLVIANVTRNAEVERCHRTVYDYAIVGNEDRLVEALQHILDHALYELNYLLPSQATGCAGRPPILAHPELLQPRRPFRADQEVALFDLHRVDAYLATLTWQRTPDQNGRISLGSRQQYYCIGRCWAGCDISIYFDPTDRHFVFCTDSAHQNAVKRLPAKALEVDDLTRQAAWPSGPAAQQLRLPLVWP